MTSRFIAALALLCAGCGLQSNTDEAPEIPTVSLAEAQRIALLSQVSCFSDEDCHPSVAMLVIATERGVGGRCTGWLISPDILATNSHCLPPGVDRPGDDCSGRIWGFFPKAGSAPEERVECGKVLSNTGNSGTVPGQDIAFLSLKERTKRPELRVSREGFPDASHVSVVKVNPIKGSNYPLGVMQTVQCRVSMHTQRLPAFDDQKSPVISLSTCEIVGGNSGGPIVDARGEVRGIIQAVFNTTQGIAPESLLESRTERLNMGTSLACVRTPLDGGVGFPDACRYLPGMNDRGHVEKWENDVNFRLWSHAESQVSAWTARQPSAGMLGWKATEREKESPLIPRTASFTSWDTYALAQPHCLSRGAREGTYSLRLPIYHYRRGYDEFLTYSFKPGETVAEHEATLTLRSQGSRMRAVLVARDPQGHELPLFDEVLGGC
ncbi:MAG TPA: serine protease [Bdellovibrionota bacterium]|nr:serine protease [Bdellovibrionota bacterium]